MCYNLWPWGPRGEVGFLSKNTQLFSPRTFLGQECPQAVPHCHREVLIVFWEFIPKLGRKNRFFMEFWKKIPPKPLRRSKRTPIFSSGIASPVGRNVQKGQVQVSRQPQGGPKGKAKISVLWSLAFGSKGRNWVYLQKQPSFSPLRDSLGRWEYPQTVPIAARRFWWFLGIYSKIKPKKLICHGILEKKNLSKLLRDSKMTMFFPMTSRRPWEDTCKSLDQNSKTVPRRPTRKGWNQCIIPFDLSD